MGAVWTFWRIKCDEVDSNGVICAMKRAHAMKMNCFGLIKPIFFFFASSIVLNHVDTEILSEITSTSNCRLLTFSKFV